MSDPRWTTVDAYLADLFAPHDEALADALAASGAAGLPDIQVSPPLGRFLQLLATVAGARRILEIGTLGGYSTIWLARALPAGGRLVTLELQPHHADVARSNFARAGLDDRVEVIVGPALDSLRELVATGTEPFDFVFIDADKEPYADYLALSLRLARPGTVIIADNVVRGGIVADASTDDSRALGARRFHAAVAGNPNLVATVIQTLGVKGYDGFSFIVVKGTVEAG